MQFGLLDDEVPMILITKPCPVLARGKLEVVVEYSVCYGHADDVLGKLLADAVVTA
jgi:hypothetical protein